MNEHLNKKVFGMVLRHLSGKEHLVAIARINQHCDSFRQCSVQLRVPAAGLFDSTLTQWLRIELKTKIREAMQSH